MLCTLCGSLLPFSVELVDALHSPLSHGIFYVKCQFLIKEIMIPKIAISDRGNSLEDERSNQNPSRISPPAIHLSPSRQSSSSTDQDPQGGIGSYTGTTVAKKKRELFSARSSRSGGSNQSSGASDFSHERSLPGSKVCNRLEVKGLKSSTLLRFCTENGVIWI